MVNVLHLNDPRSSGLLLCLLSALGFGAMAVLAKGAYAGGAEVVSLLAVRFGLACVALWGLVAVRARVRGVALTPSRPSRRAVRTAAPGLALGVLYAVEAGAFFVALERIDAALAELLLYGYPALVVLGAAALGRERLTARRLAALGLATGGVLLVLAGGSIGSVDLVGVGAALLSSVLYAAYTLAGEGVVRKAEPVLLTAQVTTGAAVSLIGFGLATGGLSFGFTAGAWAAVGAIVVLCTVLPVLAFLAGVKRVGSSTAAVVSCVEPFLTVSLAWVVLGERLGPTQLAGGALVVAALVVLSGRPLPQLARGRRRGLQVAHAAG